jgi:hypothetical protein
MLSIAPSVIRQLAEGGVTPLGVRKFLKLLPSKSTWGSCLPPAMAAAALPIVNNAVRRVILLFIHFVLVGMPAQVLWKYHIA